MSDINWEIDIPLVTNRNMVGAWFKAMAATFLLSMLIPGSVFVGTGEFDALPVMAGVFALVVLGLSVVGLMIMWLVFGNRFRAAFTVTDEGISFSLRDTRARVLSRFAVVAGGIAGHPGATGAGLLATSSETLMLRWSGAFSARYQPRRHVIVLRNRWRDVMHVYCGADNYDRVKARVSQSLREHGTETRAVRGRSPLPRMLSGTALVVAASLPLFALNDMIGLDVFVPLLTMVFSLATLWLIPLFGWVVLPAVAYLLFEIAVSLAEVRELQLVSTYRYRRYELLDGDEWLLLLLVLAGLGYLSWMAWRALRGRLVPLLLQDYQDRGA